MLIGARRPIFFPARFHPLAVAPFVALEIVNQRRRFDCPMLIEKRERIALEQKRAGLRANLELVMRAFADARQK